jgi:putative glutamine transport system permease protein
MSMQSGPFSIRNWETLFSDWQFFAQGFARTLLISGLGLLFTLIIGIALGMVLCSKQKVLKAIIKAYMSVFQNTPLVMQVFIYYNVLPRIGIRWDTVSIGVIGLALYTGAYAADIVASAIRAVPFGQMEAASSQGFSFMGSMFRVVLPQAVKIGLPPMTNQAVNLIKNSSVMAVIAGGELMYAANSWGFDKLIYGPTFVLTGVLYLAICLPISLLARRLEKRSMSNG